mgnify:CR=1 FL=1
MQLFKYCLSVIFVCSIGYGAAYDNFDDPQRIKIREEIMPVYEQEGVEAGRRAVEAMFSREVNPDSPQFARQSRKFYSNLWKQAQLHTPDRDWSNSIYEFIFESSLDGDWSGKTSPLGEMVLVRKMTESAITSGRLEKARELVEFGKRISRYHGQDAALEGYPMTGDLLPQFPGLPTRTYATQELRKDRESKHEFLDPIHYVDFYLHEILAKVAFQRGKWEEAAQYADWLRQYGSQYWTDTFHVTPHLSHMRHGKAFFSRGTRMLADILSIHGYREASAEMLETLVVDHPVEVYRTWYADHMHELSARNETGKATLGLDRWLLANEQYLQSSKYGGEPALPIRHLIARYQGAGKKAKASEVISRFASDSPVFWETTIELYERGMQAHPDLEDHLISTLEYKRTRALKIDEPRLYRIYAKLLAEQGRWEEALWAQRESIRLYEAMRIPNRALAGQATYLHYLYAAGLNDLLLSEQDDLRRKKERHVQPLPEWIRDEIGVALKLKGAQATELAAVPPVDLQPRIMRTVTLPGSTVYTRFSLSNPAMIPQDGVLTLTPPGHLFELDDGTLQISWLDPQQAQASHPIAMPAYSQKRLYLEAPLPDVGQEEEMMLQWQQDTGSKAESSYWVFSQESTESSVALTSASRARQNPFYLVPLYQSLVRTHSDGAERVAFRVTCSHSTRVEVYRDSDEALIYIDHNGDGDLHGSGDVLFGEVAENNHPEIEFGDGEDLAGLLIYVLPEGEVAEPIEIEVSIRQNDEWITQTMHRLEP